MSAVTVLLVGLVRVSNYLYFHIAKTLYRKFETNIPRNEIARPLSRFLHSCTIYILSHHWSTYFWKSGTRPHRIVLGIHKSDLVCSAPGSALIRKWGPRRWWPLCCSPCPDLWSPPAKTASVWRVLKYNFWRSSQCCGSGSGIRCLFDPWIWDPE